jgi:hypothetical protein
LSFSLSRSEDDLHPHTKQSGDVGLRGIGRVDRDFEIRANGDTVSEAEPIEGLDDALVTLAGANSVRSN